MVVSEPLKMLKRRVVALKDPLYCLVDGAQDLGLAIMAREAFGQQIRSLFQGPQAESLAHVAPYFFAVDPVSDFLHFWDQALGKNAGILFTSKESPDQIYAHLRSMFIVRDEEDREFFFRYYDPRVFRAYLPTCTAEELSEFFGPASHFLVENEAGKISVYSLEHAEVKIDADPPGSV